MKPACVAAVNAAAGRQLTDAQLAKIESAVGAAARRLARGDRERWQGLSADQRTIEAGVQAVKDLQAEASLKKFRATLQVLKTADTGERISTFQRVLGDVGRNKALAHDMQVTADYIAGVKEEAISGLQDLINGAKNGEGVSALRKVSMFLFDVENPAMTRDLALEIYSRASGSTGNDLAKKGAEAWLKTIEPMRQRFNAAGGDVGKLDYGYLPQAHDATRVLKAGQDAWADKTMPLLDRKQYVNEDGSSMSDAQVRDMLRAAWETISTEGQNKVEPGAYKGTGARSNKGSEGREIHFKDGEAYIAYNAEFGRGSMYEAMLHHLGGMSRDIGLVERYGPNPETQMRLQMDLAARADGGVKYVQGNTPEGYWRMLSGASGVPQNALVARLGSNSRAVQTMGKLGSAVITSITDVPTYFMTTGYNKLPYWKAITNYGRAMTKDTREFMAAHGIIAESMIGDMNRFSGEQLTTSFAGRMANSTMKLGLLNAWTDTLRNAFQLTMMGGLGRMAKTDWRSLTEFDRFRMESHGLTEADWKVMQQAKLTPHKGMDFLTPESIHATDHPDAPQIVSKVLGLIKDEGENAVLNPDLATKAIQTWGGTQAGTIKGELARATMQFKSFPIAMATRHWRRMMETPRGLEGAPAIANPAVYGAMLGVSLTTLGAIALQAKQIVSGKDPIDMTGEHAGKFWLQAFVQGGGASIVGDMLLKDTTENGASFASATAKAVLGPTIGNAFDAFGVLKDNLDKALKHQKTHTGADLTRVVRSNMPFVNLWYAKAAVDHLGMHALQENLSPGYLAKVKERAAKEWGQHFWWKPGTGLPERAPDVAKAVSR